MSNVTHIYVAPARGAPMVLLDHVDAIEGIGLAGDRYAKKNGKVITANHATLIEKENIDAFIRETGYEMTLDMPRRNIITIGIRLNDLCGKRFRIGDAIFEGIELCEPCKLFSKRTYKEALKFFVGKGGLRAKVISTGKIRIDDLISEIL